MTTERDVERVLERWLVDGIDEMPDRVFTSIVDRVERQPQQRAWRVTWRDSTVNAYLKPILAIAAVLVLAVGGIAFIARPSGSSVGVAVPTLLPSPSPTPSPPPLPDGSLDAGDYVLRALEGDPMAFTITAPAGWIGFGGFFLAGPNTSSAPNGIGISVNHDPQVVTDPCDASVHTPPPASNAPSVDSLVAAISAGADLPVPASRTSPCRLHAASASTSSSRLTWRAPTTTCSRSQRACMPTARRTVGGSGSSTSTARRASSCCSTTRAPRPRTAPLLKRPSTQCESPGSRSRARAPR